MIDLAHEPPFYLGAMRVVAALREVHCDSQRQSVEPRIMQVLVVLARNRGRVVSRHDLIVACWEGRIVGDEALNRCIAAIRRLAEAHASFAITTVPRVGYRLDEADGPVIEATTRPQRIAASPHPRTRATTSLVRAHLDALTHAKPVAQLAAVVGSTFSYALLHALAELGHAELQLALTQLEAAELICVSGLPPDASYRFKQASIHKAAYESLSTSECRGLHARVARTLDERFPALAAAHPEILEQHWSHAEEAEPQEAAAQSGRS